MRYTHLCLVALLAVASAQAEEPAKPKSSILLCTELCFDARQGDRSLRKESRPTVLTADQAEAVVVVEDNPPEQGFRQQLKVQPHLDGDRIQLNLNALVSQGQQTCLQQTLQASVTPGSPVVCEIESPQSLQKLRVVVTPWVIGPQQRFQGIDKSTGKPILVEFVSK